MMGGVPKLLERDLIEFYRLKGTSARKYHIDDREYNLPESFSWLETWPGFECQVEVQEQGECGACYAFASTAMLAERFCIKQKRMGVKYQAALLSTQYLISCDALDYGC